MDDLSAAAEAYAKMQLVIGPPYANEAFAAGARWAFEQAASMFTTGRFCRLADHMQGVCDCAEIAAAIRARASGSDAGGRAGE